MIKFSCTQCGHSYRVSDEYAGKRVKCKNCATANTIPSPEKTEQSVIGSGDSIAAYNSLLQELLKYEQQAPPLEIESSKG
jgi:hypothetical protein